MIRRQGKHLAQMLQGPALSGAVASVESGEREVCPHVLWVETQQLMFPAVVELSVYETY